MKKLLHTLDRLCLSVSRWLVYHRFAQYEWSPVQKLIDKSAREDTTGIDSAVHALKLNISDKDMLVPELGMFTGQGAYICKAWINSIGFNLPDYPGGDKIVTSSSYVNAVKAKQELDELVQTLIAYLRDTLKYDVEVGRWTRFLFEMPELLLFQYFSHPHFKDFARNYSIAIGTLVAFERKGFHNDNTDVSKARLKELETQLLHVMCSGLHLFSYKFYCELVRELPKDFAERMPAIKLKMKHTTQETFTYVSCKL